MEMWTVDVVCGCDGATDRPSMAAEIGCGFTGDASALHGKRSMVIMREPQSEDLENSMTDSNDDHRHSDPSLLVVLR